MQDTIDDLITINTAIYTLNESLEYVPTELKQQINDELQLVTTFFVNTISKKIDDQIFSVAIKQIRLMIIELFDKCEKILNNGESIDGYYGAPEDAS